MRRRTLNRHSTPRVERHSYAGAWAARRRGRFTQAIGIARKQGLKENQ